MSKESKKPSNLLEGYQEKLNSQENIAIGKTGGSVAVVAGAGAVTAATGGLAAPVTGAVALAATAFGGSSAHDLSKIRSAKSTLETALKDARNLQADTAFEIAEDAFLHAGLSQIGEDWYGRVDIEKVSHVFAGVLGAVKNIHPARIEEARMPLVRTLSEYLQENKESKSIIRKAREAGGTTTVSFKTKAITTEKIQGCLENIATKYQDGPSSRLSSSSSSSFSGKYQSHTRGKDESSSDKLGSAIDAAETAYDVYDTASEITDMSIGDSISGSSDLFSGIGDGFSGMDGDGGEALLILLTAGLVVAAGAATVAVAASPFVAGGYAANESHKKSKAKERGKDTAKEATPDQKVAANRIIRNAFRQSNLVRPEKDWHDLVKGYKQFQLGTGVLNTVMSRGERYTLETEAMITENLAQYMKRYVHKVKKDHISFDKHAMNDGRVSDRLSSSASATTLGSSGRLSSSSLSGSQPSPGYASRERQPSGSYVESSRNSNSSSLDRY